MNTSADTFTFRVLVGIKGVPAHALSQVVVQYVLGSSCANVELATSEADGVDPDDGRELFVAAWCVHPSLIPDQKILVIPEPAQPHDPCGFLFLREHEAFHSELSMLRYLARLWVVEFQDWEPPSSSSDDDFLGAQDDDDSGDSNYNGYHPGLDDGPFRLCSFGPCTVRSGAAGGAPSLRGSGVGFRPRVRAVVSSRSHCRQPTLPSVEAGDVAPGPEKKTVVIKWSDDPYQMVRDTATCLEGILLKGIFLKCLNFLLYKGIFLKRLLKVFF
jgi:hypothetical protein